MSRDLDLGLYGRIVYKEGSEPFYLVHPKSAWGAEGWYVFLQPKCHLRKTSYGDKADAPFAGDGVMEYREYAVGGTAFRTEVAALQAAVKLSEETIARMERNLETSRKWLDELRATLETAKEQAE